MTVRLVCVTSYDSPLGNLFLAADDVGLIGLWFENQTHFMVDSFGSILSAFLNKDNAQGDVADAQSSKLILNEAVHWLDQYFSGMVPDNDVSLHLIGTGFQKDVWELLRTIPYGSTTTYGQIAKQLSAMRDNKRVSAQAVGGAVKRNPVSIIVPCHRVIGANGKLTGYAGGLDKKALLLNIEGNDF